MFAHQSVHKLRLQNPTYERLDWGHFQPDRDLTKGGSVTRHSFWSAIDSRVVTGHGRPKGRSDRRPMLLTEQRRARKPSCSHTRSSMDGEAGSSTSHTAGEEGTAALLL